MFESLQGYRTYIAGILIMIAAALLYAGVLSQELFEILFGLFTGAGIVALRAGIKKA